MPTTCHILSGWVGKTSGRSSCALALGAPHKAVNMHTPKNYHWVHCCCVWCLCFFWVSYTALASQGYVEIRRWAKRQTEGRTFKTKTSRTGINTSQTDWYVTMYMATLLCVLLQSADCCASMRPDLFRKAGLLKKTKKRPNRKTDTSSNMSTPRNARTIHQHNFSPSVPCTVAESVTASSTNGVKAWHEIERPPPRRPATWNTG